MLVPARDLLDSLHAALADLKLAPGNEEPLFESVELYGNKSLGQALTDLTITKGRVCLIVPTGFRRVGDEQPSHRVLTRRYLQANLLIADRAFYKSAQTAIFGGDTNLGVIAMSERVESALEGLDLSEYGPALFGDGTQQTVADPARKEAPGREVWIDDLLIPAGTTEAVCE